MVQLVRTLRIYCLILIFVVANSEDDNPRRGEPVVQLVTHPIKSIFSVVEDFNKNALDNINGYIFEYRKGVRIPGDELLLADTKSWKFPKQDVAISINFPGESLVNDSFYVTQFRVFISQDSMDSNGYLLSGGPGHHHMDLKFVAPEAKHFTFDLRLYAINSDLVSDPNDIFDNIISDPEHLIWEPV